MYNKHTRITQLDGLEIQLVKKKKNSINIGRDIKEIHEGFCQLCDECHSDLKLESDLEFHIMYQHEPAEAAALFGRKCAKDRIHLVQKNQKIADDKYMSKTWNKIVM